MDNLSPLPNKIKQFLPVIGNFQIENFRSGLLKGGQSKGLNDFVSRIDIESEQMIKKELEFLMPKAGFYGEESGCVEIKEWMWVVDPIDGTTNYLNGIDQFSISIALTHLGKTVLGVVYKPMNKECFYCVKGQGFYHNEKRVKKNTHIALKDSLIATGFPFRNFDTIDSFNSTVKDILNRCRGIRRMGSAALDLSNTACGFFQGFWEVGLQPYDVAAAILFLEETDCIISNFKGKPYHLFEDKTFVCGAPGAFEELLAAVQLNYKA